MNRTGGRARAQRISQEVSTLATSLPVQPDSSIFLRVDEDRFDVMRAMITGPKGTPYEVRVGWEWCTCVCVCVCVVTWCVLCTLGGRGVRLSGRFL